jgi:[NiFe] hydrogenase large subunit/hydrogenase large subunit
MAKIAIDPVTRVEGHLRVEAQIDNGKVTDAWSAGTMFRGLELVLRNRDPREAWMMAQRICGVCTTVHALCSVRAVENAFSIAIPDNARLLRNIIENAQFIHDHVIHFYHLHALDWVDVVSALSADPAATATLQKSVSSWPNNTATYFKTVQDRLKSLVASNQLGIFANGYWGHPAYKLSKEANLMLVAHYLEALNFQRDFIKIHAMLGGKSPHPQTYCVGGMAIPLDKTNSNAINPGKIATLKTLAKQAVDFVGQVYLPDLVVVAKAYKDWANYGAGVGNFLAFGDWPQNLTDPVGSQLFPRGAVYFKNLTKTPVPVDMSLIKEFIAHSWYSYTGGDSVGLHPSQGQTTANYTGPTPPYDWLNTSGKYSWLKAPRLNGYPMEVGPLARIVVGYAKGQARMRELVNYYLAQLGLPKTALFSTLGRVLARGIETQILVENLVPWLDQLNAKISANDLTIANNTKWDPATWPATASGFGVTEAPRGALGHWLSVANQKITLYQAVVPTTWNASPRDAANKRGPYEESLLGTPVADPNRPLEILRTIHSFDPCMACAVHVVDAQRKSVVKIENSLEYAGV